MFLLWYNNKRKIIRLKKIPKRKAKLEKEDKNINDKDEYKNIKIIINSLKNDDDSKKIKITNKKNCAGIDNLFKEHKFDKKIYEKYNNCSIKEITIDNEESKIHFNSLDNISPSKSTTTATTRTYKNKKITYLTHTKNITYRKSKYFNNDEYFIKKLSELNKQNNNEPKIKNNK